MDGLIDLGLYMTDQDLPYLYVYHPKPTGATIGIYTVYDLLQDLKDLYDLYPVGVGRDL